MHKSNSFHRALLAAVALLIWAASSVASAESRRLELFPEQREPSVGRDQVTSSAIATLNKAVADEPKNRQARFDLIRALQTSGRLTAALAAAKDWRKSDAYNLVVVRLIGDIYSELGEQQKALRAYSAVVELLPKDARAQRALASVLKQSGELKAAFERLQAAVKLRPEDVRLAFELGDAAQRLGNIDDARLRFEKIVSNDGAPAAVRFPAKQRLAQIYNEDRRRAGLDKQSEREIGAKLAALEIEGGTQNDIKVYLTWDTDRSDVDLWVTNPAKEKIFYSHKKGQFGGTLFGDITTGYGPESFTAAKARRGTYLVQVNYFGVGRSNFPEARGEVTVVLNEGSANEKKHVLPYRLFKAKQTVTVARIEAD